MSKIKKKLSVCIIGGTGFVGRYLIEALLKESKFEIKLLTRNNRKNKIYNEKIEVIKGDLLDLNSLTSFLVPNSIVINLAFINTGPIDINIRAAENLSKACKQKKVQKLIHCSTAVIAGRVKNNLINEETVCAPKTNYEKVKLSIETILLANLKETCETIIIRPTVIFGKHGKNLLKLANELTTDSRIIKVLKNSLFGKRRMNLVSAQNVVDAIVFICKLKKNINGQCYIVSDDEIKENNYFDVSKLLAHHLALIPENMLSIPFRNIILSKILTLLGRSNINPKRNYSSKKLFELGFKKKISFEEEIKKFAYWYGNEQLLNRIN